MKIGDKVKLLHNGGPDLMKGDRVVITKRLLLGGWEIEGDGIDGYGKTLGSKGHHARVSHGMIGKLTLLDVIHDVVYKKLYNNL